MYMAFFRSVFRSQQKIFKFNGVGDFTKRWHQCVALQRNKKESKKKKKSLGNNHLSIWHVAAYNKTGTQQRSAHFTCAIFNKCQLVAVFFFYYHFLPFLLWHDAADVSQSKGKYSIWCVGICVCVCLSCSSASLSSSLYK